RLTCRIRASWDGSVAAFLTANPTKEHDRRVYADVLFEHAVQPLANVVSELAEALGGWPVDDRADPTMDGQPLRASRRPHRTVSSGCRPCHRRSPRDAETRLDSGFPVNHRVADDGTRTHDTWL